VANAVGREDCRAPLAAVHPAAGIGCDLADWTPDQDDGVSAIALPVTAVSRCALELPFVIRAEC
jgi:hypothetical protein